MEERIKEGTGLKEGAQHFATQLRTLSGALCEELSWLRPLHLQQVSYSQRISKRSWRVYKLSRSVFDQ